MRSTRTSWTATDVVIVEGPLRVQDPASLTTPHTNDNSTEGHPILTQAVPNPGPHPQLNLGGVQQQQRSINPHYPSDTRIPLNINLDFVLACLSDQKGMFSQWGVFG